MESLAQEIPAGDRRKSLSRAVRRAAPFLLGYVPVGFAYGVLAQKAGISDLNIIAMSVLVYAGSAQFIAVSMFTTGAPPLAIIATTFIVNLRHLLMSAALSPYLRKWRRLEVWAMAAELTDETFAVHAAGFASGETDKTEVFSVNLILQIVWITATLLGILASTLITDVKPMGLDYALPAMFIGLLVVQIKGLDFLLVALLSAGLSVGLTLSGADRFNVIIATLVAASVGCGVHAWTSKRSS